MDKQAKDFLDTLQESLDVLLDTATIIMDFSKYHSTEETAAFGEGFIKGYFLAKKDSVKNH